MKSALVSVSQVEGKAGLPGQPGTSGHPLPAQQEEAKPHAPPRRSSAAQTLSRVEPSSAALYSPSSSAWLSSSPMDLQRGLKEGLRAQGYPQPPENRLWKAPEPCSYHCCHAPGAAETGDCLKASVCRLQTALWGAEGKVCREVEAISTCVSTQLTTRGGWRAPGSSAMICSLKSQAAGACLT